MAFAKRGGFDLVAMVARDDNETKIDSGPLVPAPAMYQAAPGSLGSGSSSKSDSEAGPPSSPPGGGCAGRDRRRALDAGRDRAHMLALVRDMLAPQVACTRKRKRNLDGAP